MERKPLILVALLLAAFAINLDTTIVNVALPKHATARESVGDALGVAGEAAGAGHPAVATAIGEAASSSFFSGFHAGDLVAAGVAAAGAVLALALLPAHPTAAGEQTTDDLGGVGEPAAVRN